MSWDPVPDTGGAAITYVVQHNGLNVSACNRIAATQCVFPNLRYDGSRHDFRVQAFSGESQGPVSETATWTAIAEPMAWGAWTVEPTGANNQARATFTVPDSRGGSSTGEVLVGSTSVATFGPEATSKTFPVANNRDLFTVRLRVCNENNDCSTSDPQSVRTYGPLVRDFITLRSTGSGTSLGWTVTVDPNGAPVQVDVGFSGSGRPDEQYTVSPGDSPRVIAPMDLGFSVRETISVTVRDTARNRGPVSKSDSATTPDPPPPVVEVKRYVLCNDDPTSGSEPCHEPGQGQDCTDPSCGKISIKATNFFSPVTCTVTRQGFPPVDWGPFPEGQTEATDLYFGSPGVDVGVTCSSSDNSIRKSVDFPWPN